MSIVKLVLLRLLSVWLALTLVFCLLRLLPGDAIRAQLSDTGLGAAAIEQQRVALGLDQPPMIQYGHYLLGILRGDLGISLTRGLMVSEIIRNALPSTLILTFSSLCVGISLGLILGVISGLSHGILGQFVGLLMTLSLSIPIYGLGTLAILVFSVGLKWLPSSGESGISSLILPTGVLGLSLAGAIARLLSSSIRETQHADFVRTAYAKGLRSRSVISRHLLRVSILPIIPVIALQAGFLLGGVAITEILFVRPGLGRVILDATLRRDFPVVQGVVTLLALGYALLNSLSDGLKVWLDPRIRYPIA